MSYLAHPSPNPVVLVHGIDDTSAKFKIMQQFLESRGWTVSLVTLSPNNGDAGLEILAEQLSSHIDENFGPDQSIDVIGFSMGGIVSRYYLQRLGGIQRTHRFITLASPHNGTWVAYLRPNLGALQMRCQSSFLHQLNQDVEVLNQVQFTSIWTPLDLMILPADSSRLPVGENKQVPVLLHSWMVSDRRCLDLIASLLNKTTQI